MADRSTRWRFGVPLILVLLAGCAGLAVVLANVPRAVRFQAKTVGALEHPVRVPVEDDYVSRPS
jgi:hypothetical protein